MENVKGKMENHLVTLSLSKGFAAGAPEYGSDRISLTGNGQAQAHSIAEVCDACGAGLCFAGDYPNKHGKACYLFDILKSHGTASLFLDFRQNLQTETV